LKEMVSNESGGKKRKGGLEEELKEDRNKERKETRYRGAENTCQKRIDTSPKPSSEEIFKKNPEGSTQNERGSGCRKEQRKRTLANPKE